MKSEDELKNVKVNIAIIGQTGVGKSSFINTFRGIDGDHKLAAKVGAGAKECTMDVVAFRFEDNQNLVLWDLPGANTKNFPIKTYPSKVYMDRYDAFILLTLSRFTEADTEVVKHIEKTGKPFFFAKTHIDVDMENCLRQIKKDLKKLPPKEKAYTQRTRLTKAAEDFRMGCKEALADLGIEKDVDHIFLVTNLPVDEWGQMGLWVPDNDNLKIKILEGLPDLKKKALILGFCCNTLDKVDEEVEKMKHYINLATASSSIGGLVPVPGISMLLDISIMAGNAFHQLKALNIDSKSLAIRGMGLDGKVWSKEQLMDEVRKQCGEDDKLLSTWLSALGQVTAEGLVTLLPQLLSLFPHLVASSVAVEVTSTIPGIGSLIGAGMSASKTYFFLTKLLETNRKIAKSIIKVIDGKTI